MISRRKLLTAGSALVGGAAVVGSGALAWPAEAATSSTLSVKLENTTSATTIYAYVTGLAVDDGNALVLLESDGSTLYYPSSPSADGTALSADCAIKLAAGASKTITIPRIAGGRVWFSYGSKLTFLLNPGPALVEPSVTNSSDPNIDIRWDFCEFTFNSSQLYANISYVDFVSIPIKMVLTDTAGATQTVKGLASGGLSTVCTDLVAQTASDGADWSSLIVKNSSGGYLRALSPNNGIVTDSSLFDGYFDTYINKVWTKYESSTLTVETQASYGSATAKVVDNLLTFSGIGSYAKPTTANIFSCSTGPFADTAGEMGPLTARISAAFNRSTLYTYASQPNGAGYADYYQTTITNHYARIVHAANLDGLGYAFPYDDVTPTGGVNQSGYVASSIPALWTLAVGGS